MAVINFAREFAEFLTDPVEILAAPPVANNSAGAGEDEPVSLWKGCAYLEWRDPFTRIPIIDGVAQEMPDALLMLPESALKGKSLKADYWVLYQGQRLEPTGAAQYNPRNRSWLIALVKQKRR